MTTNIMIDLETLGTAAGCKILSLGAVVFADSELRQEFYMVAERHTQGNLYEEPDTVAWWEKQGDEARLAVFENADARPLGNVLSEFSDWLEGLDVRGGLRLWSNGADFDLPILIAAYRDFHYEVPWKFYNHRCFRTLKNLRKDVAAPELPDRIKHHALSDAKAQALHAIELLKALNAW